MAMKGLMVQEDLTLDDALKLMEEGQKIPNRPAPKLPPRVLGKNCTTIVYWLPCQPCELVIRSGFIFI